MSKIIFIEPKAPGEHIFTKFALPRLGIFVLGTMMKERGWDVEILIEEIHDIDLYDFNDADIIGISTITPTTPRAYSLADKFREQGIPVIMGGPHVTFLTDEALEHSDFVIRGEGEIPLMSFIDEWETKKNYTKVPNLSYKKNGKIIHNTIQKFEKNLDQFPISDFSLIKDQIPLKVIPVQTSRGCPFDCSFCSVTGMFGRNYRFRSVEHILEELERYRDLNRMIFFYDDHFAANKKRAKRLLRAMIKEGLTFKFSTQVRVELAKDEELLQLMKDAGCHTLFIGFESINPESLKEMKKSQTVEDIEHAIEMIHKYGIHIHGMFVHGFDKDTWDSVKETVNFAKKNKITSAQFLLLTPFPGSELYSNHLDRLIINDWSLYDAHHTLFQPVNFSPLELQKAQIYSHEKFYSFFEVIKKLFHGQWLAVGIIFFAKNVNRKWKKNNKSFLKLLKKFSN